MLSFKDYVKKQNTALVQFIKFGLVGLSNTIVSYVAYAIFVYAGCHYLFAGVLSFVVGVMNSFIWNNKYVFQKNDGTKRTARELMESFCKTFLSYASTGLILSNLLLFVWVDVAHISQYLGPIINLIVTIPLNFVLNKYWAFRTKK